MHFYHNQLWKEWGDKPRVSIITPVYNRSRCLNRALSSVETQSYRSFEHIVIDDGSDESESIDGMMEEYMRQAAFPVAYIKKRNGGVHTARNAGISFSRGELIFLLDSDDEMLPSCLQLFVDAWDSISADKRNEYSGVTAFCQDQTGKRIGGHLPVGINAMTKEAAIVASNTVDEGEKTGILRGDLMRSNPWPEPEGVTFVPESVLWMSFAFRFKSWYIDDVVRIYHRETEESYSNIGIVRSNQQLINGLYVLLWRINNGEKFGQSKKKTLIDILKYCVFRHVLRWHKVRLDYNWLSGGIRNQINRFVCCVLWLPSIAPAYVYNRKHAKQKGN